MRKSIAIIAAAAVLSSSCATAPAVDQQGASGPAQIPIAEAEQAWRAFNCLVGPGVPVSTYADTNEFECGMRRAMAASDERVTVNFSSTDTSLVTQAVDGVSIRGLLPPRMQRWAQAVNQSGGKVVVCRQAAPEGWALVLALATWAFRVIVEQLMPQGRAFYLPANNRDLTLTYTIVNSGQGARLTKAEFDKRPATVTANCSVAPAA